MCECVWWCAQRGGTSVCVWGGGGVYLRKTWQVLHHPRSMTTTRKLVKLGNNWVLMLQGTIGLWLPGGGGARVVRGWSGSPFRGDQGAMGVLGFQVGPTDIIPGVDLCAIHHYLGTCTLGMAGIRVSFMGTLTGVSLSQLAWARRNISRFCLQPSRSHP